MNSSSYILLKCNVSDIYLSNGKAMIMLIKKKKERKEEKKCIA